MRKHGPWTIISSEQKYKNPWMEVIEDKVIRPDGKPGIYAIAKVTSGVSILAMDDEGFVYLTEEFHYAVGKDEIIAASGGIDSGETPLNAAKRELKEELGIEASEWIDLGRVDPMTGYVDSPAIIFLARKLKFGKTSQEETERIKTLKVTLDEAVKMVMESKITHAQSCVLILKAHEYLRKRNV